MEAKELQNGAKMEPKVRPRSSKMDAKWSPKNQMEA